MSLAQFASYIRDGVRKTVIKDMHSISGTMKSRGKILYFGEIYIYEAPVRRMHSQIKVVIRKGANATKCDEFELRAST